MAWEIRRGREYLYRTYRDGNGRVCREYLGRGSRAIRAATRQKQLLQQAAADQQTVAALTAEANQGAVLLQELDAAIQTLLEAELLLAGFHKHNGTWRKRRD